MVRVEKVNSCIISNENYSNAEHMNISLVLLKTGKSSQCLKIETRTF